MSHLKRHKYSVITFRNFYRFPFIIGKIFTKALEHLIKGIFPSTMLLKLPLPPLTVKNMLRRLCQKNKQCRLVIQFVLYKEALKTNVICPYSAFYITQEYKYCLKSHLVANDSIIMHVEYSDISHQIRSTCLVILFCNSAKILSIKWSIKKNLFHMHFTRLFAEPRAEFHSGFSGKYLLRLELIQLLGQ